MRTISAPSLAKLAQNLGTEPVNIVEIQWTEGGERFSYCDKEVIGLRAKILELSGLDFVIQISGGSDSSQVNVVLDDTDSEIKNLIDNYDANKRPVWIYQWFQGLAESEKFLIFRGEIRSPFVWDEGDRTVSFSVVSKIEDAEVGFSIEEGNFPQPPDELIGKPWPIAFGTVCDIQALQATSPRQGILKSGVGISDFTLSNRICQAGYILCPSEVKGMVSELGLKPPTLGASTLVIIDFEPDIFGFSNNQSFGASEDCASDRCQTIEELKAQLIQQQAYEYSTITVIGGAKFPQSPTVITLNIDGGKFTGTFSGEVFTITSRQHPDFETTTLIDCHEIQESSYVNKPSFSSDFSRIDTSNTFQAGTSVDDTCTAEFAQEKEDGAATSQKAYDDMPTSNFFWARSGARVTLDGEEEILYIANLLPATVNRVSAFRRLATGEKLMTLPTSMYEIFQTDYGPYTVTELLFNTLPSLVPNPVNGKVDGKWGDDVYVSMTSSVGPNTVDILQYLIETYTTFDIDAASFASVHTSLADYPSGFAILDRRNVVEVLREIAEQARCAIYVRDNTVFLKYLSEEPTSVATINEDDVIANSLTVEHTDTEDVVTKSVATWQKSGGQEKPDEIILRHNIKKYGVQEETTDYYTYNVREHILKSATFWLIRKSNTWRRVSFRTTIKHLALEIFDCVTLDLSDVAPSPIKVVVEKATFNSDSREIEFQCWTPLKAGTTIPYVFAWPASVAAATEFPTQEEIDAGFAGGGDSIGYTMVPPPDHLLAAQTVAGDNRADWGDRFPSDLDDTLISVSCPIGADVDLEDEEAPVLKAFRRAARASRQADTNAENVGAGSGGDNQPNKKSPGLCGEEDPSAGNDEGNCRYAVTVTYGRVLQVGNPGPDTTQGAVGLLETAEFNSEMCHVFGSAFGARAFVSYMIAQILELHNNATVGQNVPLTAINSGSAGGATCAAAELAQGENPGPNDGKKSSNVKPTTQAVADATGSEVGTIYPPSGTIGSLIINRYVQPVPGE